MLSNEFFKKSLLVSAIALALTACGGGGGHGHGGSGDDSGSGSGGSDTPEDPTPSQPEKTVSVSVNAKTAGNFTFDNDLASFTANADDAISNLRIFQIMVAAFQDGDSGVGYGTGYGTSSFKGDLKGVINALDYIQSTGFNAIWLTPVFESASSSDNASKLDSTGYYAKNYFKIDSHFGDEATLKKLVEEVHKRNMYIFLDGVFGHFKKSVNKTSRNGSVLVAKSCGLEDIGALCADFDKAGTLDFFKDVATYYIKEFKIDGWRLDQAYQVPVSDWNKIRTAVEEAAGDTADENGDGDTVHPLGYMVGEIWKGDSDIVNEGYGTASSKGLLSNFAFGMRYGVVQTLACEESGASDHTGNKLYDMIRLMDSNYPSFAIPNFFLSNHDLVRFGDLIQRSKKLGQISSENYASRYFLAHALTSIFSGPMTVLYGDEFGQDVPNFDVQKQQDGYYEDHVSRVDGKISGFTDTQKKIRDGFVKLMTARAHHPALYRGKMDILNIEKNVVAIKKYTEGDDAESVVFAMNLSESDKAEMTIDASIAGAETALMDAVTCAEYTAEGGKFKIPLAPLSGVFLSDPDTLGAECGE